MEAWRPAGVGGWGEQALQPHGMVVAPPRFTQPRAYTRPRYNPARPLPPPHTHVSGYPCAHTHTHTCLEALLPQVLLHAEQHRQPPARGQHSDRLTLVPRLLLLPLPGAAASRCCPLRRRRRHRHRRSRKQRRDGDVDSGLGQQHAGGAHRRRHDRVAQRRQQQLPPVGHGGRAAAAHGRAPAQEHLLISARGADHVQQPAALLVPAQPRRRRGAATQARVPPLVLQVPVPVAAVPHLQRPLPGAAASAAAAAAAAGATDNIQRGRYEDRQELRVAAPLQSCGRTYR